MSQPDQPEPEPEPEIYALRERLSLLGQASLRITQDLHFNSVLRGDLDSARSLTNARHGVIVLHDGVGVAGEFLSSGMTADQTQRLWTAPRPADTATPVPPALTTASSPEPTAASVPAPTAAPTATATPASPSEVEITHFSGADIVPVDPEALVVADMAALLSQHDLGAEGVAVLPGLGHRWENRLRQPGH